MESLAEKLRRRDVHLDAHFVRPSFRAGIADRSARIHAAGARNRARAGEDVGHYTHIGAKIHRKVPGRSMAATPAR